MLYKKWTDYLPEIYDMYPNVPKFIVRMTISFGLRWVFRLSKSKRIRTEIKDGDFSFSIGNGKDTSKKIQRKKNSKTIYDIYFIPKWIKINKFEGYYYIPVSYSNFLGLRHGKPNLLKNVFATTNLEIAKLKSVYVIRIKSFRNFGECIKFKKIAFVDYEAFIRDCNFRIDYYKTKNEYDYV